MKKIIILLTLALFGVSEANAASYYFSSSTGNNGNPGTQVSPFHDFKGTTLDNASALSPGDNVYFLCGDTWEASEAEVAVQSSGTSGSRITIDRYGTCTGSNDPIFYGAPVTLTWTLVTGSIYKKTGQTQTHIKTVAQGADLGLGNWRGLNNTLPTGTWCLSSNTTGAACGSGTVVYVRLWGDSNPDTTANVRIASFSHTAAADGGRGLVRSYESSAYGYITFKHIKVVGANGVGVSSSGPGVWFEDSTVNASGQDGVLCYYDSSGELCTDMRFYGTTQIVKHSLTIAQGATAATSKVSYNAAGGGGYGQGITAYGGPGFWVYNTLIENNFMAGLDFLDFSSTSNATEVGAFGNIIRFNGRWQDSSGSYDSNVYLDGPHKWWISHNIIYGSGKSSGATNARAAISIGSEYPSLKFNQDGYIIGNLIFYNNDSAVASNEICYGDPARCPPDGNTAQNNIKNHTIIGNTFITPVSSCSSNFIFGFYDFNATANNLKFRNNLLVAYCSEMCSYFTPASYYSTDYNLYYLNGNTSASTILFRNNSFGSTWTIAQWRTLTGGDASAVANSDPLLVAPADDATMDAHLGAGSPAIDTGMESAFTVPTWIPADILNVMPCRGAVCGTTRASGAPDDVDTSIDIGFHYPTDVTPNPTNALGINITGTLLKGTKVL